MLAKAIRHRIDGAGIKGRKRQADEALAYACGFATALDNAGFDVSPLAGWISFDLAFQGMPAVDRVIALEAVPVPAAVDTKAHAS